MSAEEKNGLCDVAVSHDQTEKILTVRNLSHKYGSVTALKKVSCHALRGEFVTLLGSSGSGKSTLLRMLAGLEMPSEVDELTLDGRDVSQVPANRRNVSTVFQHYGLFPHLSVIENVEYGLRVRKVGKEERQRRAMELLKQVQLADFAERSVQMLSGGQKQRVALARSLVLEPAILLLDEPLGALDEKLRIDMQIELVQLQRRLGMTFIYVTHSQEEALTMSDRILMMDNGEIVQEGSPEDIFDRPNSRFAAEFMGMENILEAKVSNIGTHFITAIANDIQIRGIWTGSGTPSPGQDIVCAFRAEKIKSVNQVASGDVALNQIDALPFEQIYKGKYLDVTVETILGKIRIRVWDDHFELGEQSKIAWRADQTIFLAK